MDLYIYYRAAVIDAPAILVEAAALQRLLHDACGVQSTLKRRPEAVDGRHTWMEVYYAVPEDFARQVERMLSQTGLISLVDGTRHTEFFLDCPPCA